MKSGRQVCAANCILEGRYVVMWYRVRISGKLTYLCASWCCAQIFQYCKKKPSIYSGWSKWRHSFSSRTLNTPSCCVASIYQLCHIFGLGTSTDYFSSWSLRSSHKPLHSDFYVNVPDFLSLEFYTCSIWSRKLQKCEPRIRNERSNTSFCFCYDYFSHCASTGNDDKWKIMRIQFSWFENRAFTEEFISNADLCQFRNGASIVEMFSLN